MIAFILIFQSSYINLSHGYRLMHQYWLSTLKIPHDISLPKGRCARPVSFLPVPVAVSGTVRKAFNSRPLSHRSSLFRRTFDETVSLLRQLTGSAGVELLLGSGTLANDVVAAQLGLLEGEGLVLVNGEFGERLADHGSRHGLQFETIVPSPGADFDYAALDAKLTCGRYRWIWAVHCETFTGTLTDLERLKQLCRTHGVLLCMDCISSLGVVPVRLDGVYLATGISGKGLGGYPGISLVFYNHEPLPDARLPRCLDLGHYRSKAGIPFTHSWNLLAALREALCSLAVQPKFERVRTESAWLRGELEKHGFTVVKTPGPASPAVLTLVLPPAVFSVRLGEELERCGYLVSYTSALLTGNNALRICLMGDTRRRHHRELAACMVHLYRGLQKAADKEKEIVT